VIGTLSALFTFARSPRRRWAATNPCDGAELPALPEAEEIRFLTRAELAKLVDHARRGMYQEIDRVLYLVAAMTGLRLGELLALRWRDVDWVAGVIRVRRYYVRGRYGTQLHEALEDAGLNETHVFHDLRHTFATMMAAAGVPMRTLQEWMGHRHMITTERYADYAPRATEGEWITAAFAVATGVRSEPDHVVASSGVARRSSDVCGGCSGNYSAGLRARTIAESACWWTRWVL
jgi:integrase